MPRYFLHLRDHGTLFKDVEGVELPDEHAVREEAVLTARDHLRVSGTSVRDWLGRTYEIVDEDERFVMAVPFPDALDTVVP